MARKRMIDPEFWQDEKLGECTRDERLLFMGLISNADDEGYGRANVKLVKSNIFPYDDDLKAKDIEKMLSSLMNKKLIIVYVVEGQDFYCLPNFTKHQVINKPTASKLPVLPQNIEEIQLPYYYGSDTVALPPKRKEVNRIEDKRIDDFFESVWSLYPKKEGKGQISQTQKQELFKIGLDEITRAIERYCNKIQDEKTEHKFIKMGSTFFNSGYIDFLDANYMDKPKSKYVRKNDVAEYRKQFFGGENDDSESVTS